jgi:branched-chain amino acid transport system ATP-binding protein
VSLFASRREERPMPLLECRGLTRRFGGLVAVDTVNMNVEAGEIRAVIGPNGAGKSTLFNVVTGVMPPSNGDAFFAGEKITGLPVYRVIQNGIARTFQLTHLFPTLTARENVRLAAQARFSDRWRPLAGRQVFADTGQIADEALEQTRLSALAHIKAGTLAHGDQRLLEIAMAIAQRPSLLMLDEPTQGLSIDETDNAVQILRDMLAKGDLTVILVEHDMEVVFKLAHKITVLHRGRVIADGTPDEVKANHEVQSAYLGGLD